MRTTTAYFIVDTGSHRCSISNRLVTLLGLNPLAELKPGETTVQPVQIPGLQFGNVYARRVRADVSDPDSPTVDGILGMNQLASLAVEFDFQQHQMRLWKPEMVASNVDWIKHKATFQLPLTEPEPYGYTVPITVNNTSVRQAFIDTGSDGIVLTQRQSEELHLKPEIEDTSSFAIGEITMGRSVVRTFQIGPHTLTNLPVEYDLQAQRPIELPFLLGMNVLSQFKVLLDLPHHKIYCLPVEHKSYVIDLTKIYSPEALPFGPPAASVLLKDGKRHTFAFQPAGYTNMDLPLGRAIGASSPGASAIQPDGQSYLGPVSFAGTDLKFPSMSVGIADFVKNHAASPYIEGWLGMEFLQSYALQLDLVAHRVTLISPGIVTGTPFVPPGAKRVPLWFISDLGYVTEMMVDGKPARFIINLTSYNTNLLVSDLVRDLHPVATDDILGDSPDLHIARINSLGVEGAMWRDSEVVTSSTEAKVNQLARDFFERFNVILDFAGQAMYLSPNKNFREESKLLGIGLGNLVTQDGKLVVKTIASLSPAHKAGISVGDEIVSLNGKPAARLSSQTLYSETQKPRGAEIIVQFRHQGEDKIQEVRLKASPLALK